MINDFDSSMSSDSQSSKLNENILIPPKLKKLKSSKSKSP